MNARQHTLLARALIDACGGVDACRKPVTRVEQSQLYAYRDFNSGVFMPADIIDRLESLCGNPVYSQFLFDAQAAPAEVGDVVDGACSVAESAIDLQRLVRLAARDGELSENEKREIEAGLQQIDLFARQLRVAMDARKGAAETRPSDVERAS